MRHLDKLSLVMYYIFHFYSICQLKKTKILVHHNQNEFITKKADEKKLKVHKKCKFTLAGKFPEKELYFEGYIF